MGRDKGLDHDHTEPEDRISREEEEVVKKLLSEVSYSGDDSIVPSIVNKIGRQLRRFLLPRTSPERLEQLKKEVIRQLKEDRD